MHVSLLFFPQIKTENLTIEIIPTGDIVKINR